MGSRIFFWILYIGVQELLPCLFNLPPLWCIFVHFEMSDHIPQSGCTQTNLVSCVFT